MFNIYTEYYIHYTESFFVIEHVPIFYWEE